MKPKRQNPATAFLAACALLLLGGGTAYADEKTDLSDSGWRLWLDEKATWQSDTLYLPDKVDLTRIPVNSPTGGWDILNETAGIPVTLPGTVEEHYWGQHSPCDVSPSTKPSDIVEVRSQYKGVSWWYRKFTPPELKPGERLEISFRGARMRAEVYVNGRLVGYNLITEVPFTVDATAALKPEQDNLLAVRITNPGGNFEWGDAATFDWGKYKIPWSHGFGGLDGGVTMAVRGPVCVSDLATLNNPDPKTVTLVAELQSTGPAYNGPVALTITREGKPVWSGTLQAQVPADGKVTVSQKVTVDSAELWDVNHSVLYQARASVPTVDHSDRDVTFGFRWFTPVGLGKDAMLTMNSHRLVVRSAISWGYWAPDGLFPDEAAVQREIAAVHAIGLDGVNNHRHMPHPLLLDGFDRAGLLRYCEPGAGDCAIMDGKPLSSASPQPPPPDTSGNGGEPSNFTNSYELAKILGMIKANRSHPCVTVWTIQNEAYHDLHDPKIFYVLRKMREMDPSRPVLLKSGYPPNGQAWLMPYSTDFVMDNGTGVSGWRDTHTCDGFPGVWCDTLYKSPTDFLYHTDVTKEIVGWGEMATGASCDNDTAAAAWYKAENRPGYDRAAHEVLLAAYEKYLDDFGFRSTYPTPAALQTEIGNKHYFAAARVMENGRICDANDFLTLSGWESTTVDNHSGLVDEVRDLKGDPTDLKRACAPQLLVIRPRHYVVAKGGTVAFDVYSINETDRTGPPAPNYESTPDQLPKEPIFKLRKGNYVLKVEATAAHGASLFKTSIPVELKGGDVFSQLLKDNLTFPANEEGPVQLTASLSSADSVAPWNPPLLTRTEPMLIVDPNPSKLGGKVIAIGGTQRLSDALAKRLGVTMTALADAPGPVDVVLVDSSDGPEASWGNPIVEVKTLPPLYWAQLSGPATPRLTVYHGLADGGATVEIHFAELFSDGPGQRLFDLALNGQTVLQDFDILKEAGGKNLPLVKKFTVNITDGNLAVSIPKVSKGSASLAAIQITDAKGRVIRETFRKDNSYTDPQGKTWNPVKLSNLDWDGILPGLLQRVQNDGTRLVIMTGGGNDIGEVGAALAARNICTYSGIVGGNGGASWKGTWYFSKKHWLLNGLPSGCVLDWPFQINANNSNGFMISGPGVEAIIGYGRDHTQNIGLGAATIKYGRGEIVLLCLPGLARSFASGEWRDFQPVTATRIIHNLLDTTTR